MAMRSETIAVHFGYDSDPATHAAAVPIYQTAAYTFDSAEAFLGTAAGNNADCLVLDIQLGDMSGVILARRLAETGLKFPIIFMTAVDDPEIRSQVAQLGCITCLRKPFSADLLIEAIVKAIG